MKASSNNSTTLLKTTRLNSLLTAILTRLNLAGWFTEKTAPLGKVRRSDLTELRVWKEWNHQGQVVWSAYDPRTNRSVRHLCEDQMRTWIEQRNHY